jgi:antitoxin ParD1/3/4
MTLNVSLTPQLEDFIRRKVESGMFASASEVVRASLRRMNEAEAEIEELRAAIQEGADSGPGIPMDEVFDELEAELKAEIEAMSENA